MKIAFRTLIGLTLIFQMPLGQAGIIEDLLAVPAIQALLGRQLEIQPLVQRCSDARFKPRNVKLCQQAEEASRLAKMPIELRAVMSNPTTAVSMRELCLAVQAAPARNSYLCAELAKADVGFKAQMEQQRLEQENLRMQQNRESPT